jgi:hypothetical protein
VSQVNSHAAGLAIDQPRDIIGGIRFLSILGTCGTRSESLCLSCKIPIVWLIEIGQDEIVRGVQSPISCKSTLDWLSSRSDDNGTEDQAQTICGNEVRAQRHGG